MVSKATHTAPDETQTLIGFINYTACYMLGGLKRKIMSDFKVGCSPLTSRLFAGKVLKNGMWGQTKHDVTDSAVGAVAQHLLQLDEKMQFNYKGELYEIKVVKVAEK